MGNRIDYTGIIGAKSDNMRRRKTGKWLAGGHRSDTTVFTEGYSIYVETASTLCCLNDSTVQQ